jgi:hypothetical protein
MDGTDVTVGSRTNVINVMTRLVLEMGSCWNGCQGGFWNGCQAETNAKKGSGTDMKVGVKLKTMPRSSVKRKSRLVLRCMLRHLNPGTNAQYTQGTRKHDVYVIFYHSNS